MGTWLEEISQHKRLGFYLISAFAFLLTVLLLVAVFYFWEEIKHVRGYGYVYGFLISIMAGITIIPAPSILATFTLGRVLNPLYVGLIAGLGEALGGITIYLTGAGVGTAWSRFWAKEPVGKHPPGLEHSLEQNIVIPVESQFWSKGEAFYNRLADWVGRRRGYVVLFLAAAVPLSPFYFAGLAAGTLRMGLPRYFLVSWAGKTVKGLAVASIGYWGLRFLLPWIGA